MIAGKKARPAPHEAKKSPRIRQEFGKCTILAKRRLAVVRSRQPAWKGTVSTRGNQRSGAGQKKECLERTRRKKVVPSAGKPRKR